MSWRSNKQHSKKRRVANRVENLQHDFFTREAYQVLDTLVPERKNVFYALYPSMEEFTLMSLNPDQTKIQTSEVEIKPGTIVADMFWSTEALKIINDMSRAESSGIHPVYKSPYTDRLKQSCQRQLAQAVERYRKSMMPYNPSNPPPYRIPELLIPK